MRWLRRILMAISGVALVAWVMIVTAPKTVRAAVSALVTVTNGASNPVAVNFPSHLGVPTSNFVSLDCGGFATSTYTSISGSFTTSSVPAKVYHLVDQCSDWYLNNVGGTGQDGYSVPAGYNLVITDIEVFVSSASGNGLTLSVAPGGSNGSSNVLRDAGTYDSNGYAVFREHLITGFSCTAIPMVAVDEVQAQAPLSSNSPHFNIQGYLVPVS